MPDLEKIYIRAFVESKWGSYSLKELVDLDKSGQVFNWILNKMCGINQGDKITLEHIEKLIALLPEDTYITLK